MADEDLQQEQAPEPTPPMDGGNKVTINLDEVEDEGDSDEGKQQAAPDRPDKKTRRQQARDFRRQKEEYERNITDLRTQLARLEGRISQPGPAPQPPGGGSGVDPAVSKLAALDRQQAAIAKAIAAATTDEDAQALTKDWRELEEQRRELQFERFAEKRGLKPVQEQLGEERLVQMQLRAEFPQIFRSESMRHRAIAEIAEMVERGKPEDIATAREACQRVLQRAGLGKPPPPSDLERSRLSGIPSRAGASGSGSSNTYTPNNYEMSLAKAFTKDRPNMSDQERWVYWAKATGNFKREAG